MSSSFFTLYCSESYSFSAEARPSAVVRLVFKAYPAAFRASTSLIVSGFFGSTTAILSFNPNLKNGIIWAALAVSGGIILRRSGFIGVVTRFM